MSRTALFWLALLMFVMGGSLLALALKQSYPLSGAGTTTGEVIRDPEIPLRLVGADEPILKRFELTDRSEKKIGTRDLEGKIHIVSFFFATCPATCKTQNHMLGNLVKEFGPQGVKFLAITCDPDTDTPAKLREYAAANFNAPQDTWYFLTGDLLYTRRIAAEIYGVALDRKSHVERFILVDRVGKIVGKYAWADEKEFQALKRELKTLLDVKAPAVDSTAPAATESSNAPADASPVAKDAAE